MTWLKRWLWGIPKEQPRFDFAIFDGKRIEFGQPLTTWQAIARIGQG